MLPTAGVAAGSVPNVDKQTAAARPALISTSNPSSSTASRSTGHRAVATQSLSTAPSRTPGKPKHIDPTAARIEQSPPGVAPILMPEVLPRQPKSPSQSKADETAPAADNTQPAKATPAVSANMPAALGNSRLGAITEGAPVSQLTDVTTEAARVSAMSDVAGEAEEHASKLSAASANFPLGKSWISEIEHVIVSV